MQRKIIQRETAPMRSLAAALILMAPSPALAHFLEIIPSSDMATGTEMMIDLTFTHPMERGPVMEMAEPDTVGVFHDGIVTDLHDRLKAREADGMRAWRFTYKPDKPGGYIYFAVPQPYWEPGENKYIIHYSKVMVDYASGEDWDTLVGLPVEIQPLSRPYGLWTGNLFRGIALKDGHPLAGAVVEVEWRNDGSIKPPSDAFITQVVKTDSAGVFAYALPHSGWWGFNVLTDAAAPIPSPEGKPAPVELGGTIWVHAIDMK